MRLLIILLASSTLSACGGAGNQTVGSASTPAAAGGGTPGTGAGTTPGSGHTFIAPTEVKTYAGIGGVHSFKYKTNNIGANPLPVGVQGTSSQYGQLYAGDATTARNSNISITYNPRDAIFDLTINQPLGNVNQTTRFQDPAHRTDFGGASQPQDGVPDLSANGVQYLENGSGSGTLDYDRSQSNIFPIGTDGASVTRSTFFYQKPGTPTKTKYVTFAGFVRNATSTALVVPSSGSSYIEQSNTLERAAFAYGERSSNSGVPTTGTGTYSGDMIGTLVFNPLLDTDATAPTYFQWLSGTSRTTIDFAANTFAISLNGSVTAPGFDVYTTRVFSLPAGSTFAAAGAGRIDLVTAGGFLGQFNSASFTYPDRTIFNLNIAGSSVDGAFFGPAANEVGGGFRIVGGTPDERIDILGTFVGAK
jgi:hypothetical protein